MSFDRHLDAVLVGGRERRKIDIVDYDPGWPARYERERVRIMRALGARALEIEHVGSTSVPGLAAKPIIDVLVTVADADADESFAPLLEEAGYALRVREADHRMFRSAALDVHVHVWTDGHSEVERQLRFRDRLRASAADRAAYAELKRRLAEREWPDMNHYAEAKGPFIESVLARVVR